MAMWSGGKALKAQKRVFLFWMVYGKGECILAHEGLATFN